MYKALDQNTIEMEIAPFIPKIKLGFSPTVPLVEIVNAVPYKLKSSVQWNQLPVKVLFEGYPLTWNAVYSHYRKWCLLDTLKDSCVNFLKNHKKELDLSGVDLVGSHTPAIRGGTEVEYQGKKKKLMSMCVLTNVMEAQKTETNTLIKNYMINLML
jgi:hypothetical protein